MASLQFTVAADKCVQCDACVKNCPWGIIKPGGPVPTIPEEPEDGCLECQQCLAVCPTGAVSIFGLKPENSLPLAGVLPTRLQMKTFARGRRSVRQYHEESIPAETIDELLADLAHAPTGCNDRDLVFTVVEGRAAMVRLLEKITATVDDAVKAGREVPEFVLEAVEDHRNGNDVIFRGASHLLVVSPGTKATCGMEDAVLSLAYFELLAQSAGLGTVWCGYLKLIADSVPGIRELLGLAPESYFYAMLFGRPAVKFHRTVQRDNVAKIRRISP